MNAEIRENATPGSFQILGSKRIEMVLGDVPEFQNGYLGSAMGGKFISLKITAVLHPSMLMALVLFLAD